MGRDWLAEAEVSRERNVAQLRDMLDNQKFDETTEVVKSINHPDLVGMTVRDYAWRAIQEGEPELVKKALDVIPTHSAGPEVRAWVVQELQLFTQLALLQRQLTGE